MKIKILGTEYNIILDADEKDYPKLKGLSGYTDFSVRKIILRKFIETDETLEDLKYYQRVTLRHEIIHAFFYESGLDNNCEFARDEELVDWIAMQFEKMLGTFIEVGAISSIGIDINRVSNDPINNPVNPPKFEKAVVSVKLPEIKPLTNNEIIKEINKTMQESLNKYIVGGDG